MFGEHCITLWYMRLLAWLMLIPGLEWPFEPKGAVRQIPHGRAAGERLCSCVYVTR